MIQCHGIAKYNNQRCKRRVDGRTSQYCCHHISQSPDNVRQRKAQVDEVAISRYQKGFIYVITLKHLLEKKPQKKHWLKLNQTDGRLDQKDHASLKDFDPKDQLLIKVGLTQGKVHKRLEQWEKQCSHELQVVEPMNRVIQKKESVNKLAQYFAKLNIKGTKNRKKLQTYIAEELGFHTEKNLGLIEKKIHKVLGERYVHGDVWCYGCAAKHKLEENGYRRHIEWFMIPRKDTDVVHHIIDDIIQETGGSP